jgi:hypothetical protein
MTNYKSDGEVYGSKALTLAMIAASAFILAGTIYSPSPSPAQASPAATQQIVDTAHAAADGASG